MATDMQIKPPVRTHMGHSHGHGHGHHHHHDTTFLTSTNKNDPGVRITRIGLYVNVGMAVGKGIGGYAFNSQALTADAIHSLSDLISDFMTLATISYSLRAPSPRFPVGYGKIESLGALAVSAVLLSGGFMIGLQAVVALGQQFFPDIATALQSVGLLGHIHDHSHGIHDIGPNINAAWLAGGSILIKEWLYRATMKIAEAKRSSVLASNAYHHRVDSLTAFVALLTICASQFLANAQWLDPVGGLIISGMIVQAGVQNTKAALLELADVAIEEDVRNELESAVEAAVLGTQANLSAVQGVKSGQNFLVEVAVAIPDTLTLRQQKEIELQVRTAVLEKVKSAKRVAIRFVATGHTAQGFMDEFRAPAEHAEESQEHGHESEERTHANGRVKERTPEAEKPIVKHDSPFQDEKR